MTISTAYHASICFVSSKLNTSNSYLKKLPRTKLFSEQSNNRKSTNSRGRRKEPSHKEKKRGNGKSRNHKSHNQKKSSMKNKVSQYELNQLVRDLGLKPVDTSNMPLQRTQESHGKEKGNSIQATSIKQVKVKVPLKVQLQYARYGHAALRSVISTSLISTIKTDLIQYAASKELNAWKQKVEVATNSPSTVSNLDSIEDCKKILLQHHGGESASIEIPFLQYFNTWREIESVEALVKSPVLVSMAKALLDVPKVKLYQDSLFHKRSSDARSPTPWHSDARMAPFDTSNLITFWIPMDEIPDEKDGGTGLLFVDKSHSDFALPYWNKSQGFYDDGGDYDRPSEYDRLDNRYGGESAISHHMPLAVGDITAHAGWTLHMANGINERVVLEGNEGFGLNERYALAVTYVDDRAELREDAFTDLEGKSNENDLGHNEDRWSYVEWLKDGTIRPRQPFEHPLVPTL